ncbi:MAG: CAAX prenyl protease-related protein [Acidobacteriia bacterium]|nr:CAAX prenyl protease-related protein [Terriglobia bacterium]
MAPSTRATLAYVAPFVLYVGMIPLGLPPQVLFPLRLVIVSAVILAISRPYLTGSPSQPLASVAVGLAVFLIWIGPDVLFGYRHHWLFENAITGKAGSSLPTGLQANPLFLAVRVVSSVALVPILEELFWRGWLMRWLIRNDFLKIPLGTYQGFSFWIVAVLFASEHGPYWEVGLAAGVIYNLWVVRTRNLANCMLAHAVTNGALAIYVLTGGRWQYWL